MGTANRITPSARAARLAIACRVVNLLKECQMANAEHFPRLAPKIRAALKSAEGAKRNALRFAPDKPMIVACQPDRNGVLRYPALKGGGL